MKLILLRHGCTAGNRESRYIGRTDEPLCREGIEQVRRTGVRTEVGKVFVSPLLRARQTARLCFPRAEQLPVAALQEMNFGDFEGRTASEMAQDEVYRRWVDGNCQGRCPNGEDLAGFRRRVSEAVDEILCAAIRAGEKQVYIVAHGGTVMATMSAFVPGETGYFDWHVDNGRGWQVEVEPDTWERGRRFTAWAPVEHL